MLLRRIEKFLRETGMPWTADSDDRAHVFRSDAAQRSDLIARRWST